MVDGLEIAIAMGCFFSLWYGLLVALVLKMKQGRQRTAALSDEINVKKAAAQITDKREQACGAGKNRSTSYNVDYWFSVAVEGKMTVEVKVVNREVPKGLYDEIQAGGVEMVRYLANQPQACRLDKAHEKDVAKSVDIILCGQSTKVSNVCYERITYAFLAIFFLAPLIVFIKVLYPTPEAGGLAIAIAAVGASMFSAFVWFALPAMCGARFRDVTVTEMERGVVPREPVPVVKEEAQVISVTVPEGMHPGSVFTALAPDGRAIQVTLPPGIGPGEVILVQVPPVIDGSNEVAV